MERRIFPLARSRLGNVKKPYQPRTRSVDFLLAPDHARFCMQMWRRLRRRPTWKSNAKIKPLLHVGTFRADLHDTIFVSCDKLTTGLRHDLRLVCTSKKCRSILKHILKRCGNRKSCRKPVVSFSHETKIVPCKSALSSNYKEILSEGDNSYSETAVIGRYKSRFMKDSLAYRGSILWNLVIYNDRTTNVSFKELKLLCCHGQNISSWRWAVPLTSRHRNSDYVYS